MKIKTLKQLTADHVAVLEARLVALLSHCEQLGSENQSLRSRQAELLAEREELLQKNEQARMRIDAMVMRLKGLEDSHE